MNLQPVTLANLSGGSNSSLADLLQCQADLIVTHCSAAISAPNAATMLQEKVNAAGMTGDAVVLAFAHNNPTDLARALDDARRAGFAWAERLYHQVSWLARKESDKWVIRESDKQPYSRPGTATLSPARESWAFAYGQAALNDAPDAVPDNRALLSHWASRASDLARLNAPVLPALNAHGAYVSNLSGLGQSNLGHEYSWCVMAAWISDTPNLKPLKEFLGL